ncbi:uncharacterized protein LOC108344231 [Vigna angularis]|uniref:uncharacterized protein LOC108344231 n=1 Tax=Phaseolus angularis TaxID=3914 RepID=UPI00080A5457|nr:uncharacterized protein LOC108344231 [Vigna angularis]
MAGLGRMMQGSYPIFDGKSFDEWNIKMNAIFGFQDVADLCVGLRVFHKISKAQTTKEIWKILLKMYGDGDKNKKVKLHTLRRQFECLAMEESDNMVDYFDKVCNRRDARLGKYGGRRAATFVGGSCHRVNERMQYQDQVLQVRSQFHGKGKGSKKFGKKKHKEDQEHQEKDFNDFENRKSHK